MMTSLQRALGLPGPQLCPMPPLWVTATLLPSQRRIPDPSSSPCGGPWLMYARCDTPQGRLRLAAAAVQGPSCPVCAARPQLPPELRAPRSPDRLALELRFAFLWSLYVMARPWCAPTRHPWRAPLAPANRDAVANARMGLVLAAGACFRVVAGQHACAPGMHASDHVLRSPVQRLASGRSATGAPADGTRITPAARRPHRCKNACRNYMHGKQERLQPVLWKGYQLLQLSGVCGSMVMQTKPCIEA